MQQPRLQKERPAWQRHRLATPGTLGVLIHSATNLNPSDRFGASDPNPFVIVTVNEACQQTPVKQSTKYPVWESLLEFPCSSLAQVIDSVVHLEMRHETGNTPKRRNSGSWALSARRMLRASRADSTETGDLGTVEVPLDVLLFENRCSFDAWTEGTSQSDSRLSITIAWKPLLSAEKAATKLA